MRYNPVLPKTPIGVISAILTEVDSEHIQYDLHWVDNMISKIDLHDPVMAAYIRGVRKRIGEHAALTGLLVYRILESTLEVQQLEEMFDEDA